MTVNEDLRATVALSLVPRMGPVTFKKLMEILGSPSRVFKSSKEKWARADGFSRFKESLTDRRLFEKADDEIKEAIKGGAEIIGYFDARYPEELKAIYDPPILLYVKGTLPPAGSEAVAVVGSRTPSLYGRKMAKAVSRDLAEAGVIVVSGMAVGIDTAAHEGALCGEGVTIAVLGGGISKIYPSENKKLAEKICKKGALVSEYPMEMPPRPEYFPVRNRIISGLARAVLVVEAKEKSGALITADLALEQGRDVFAVPGNADSAWSGGTNNLLKQGAKLVTSAQDILEELSGDSAKRSVENNKRSSENKAGLGSTESRVLSFIQEEPVSVDDLIEQSGLRSNQAIAALSFLEIKGYIRQLPGKNFIRKEN